MKYYFKKIEIFKIFYTLKNFLKNAKRSELKEFDITNEELAYKS